MELCFGSLGCVHGVWLGAARSFLQVPSTLYSTLPPPKQPQTIMLHPPCLTDGIKHCSCIFSFVLLFDWTTSNFKHISTTLLPISVFYFIGFLEQFCHEVQHLDVTCPVLKLPLVFDGYHLVQLPAEDL